MLRSLVVVVVCGALGAVAHGQYTLVVEQPVADAAAADEQAADAAPAEEAAVEAAPAAEDGAAPVAEAAAAVVDFAVEAVEVAGDVVIDLQAPAAVAPAGDDEEANLAPYLAQFRPIVKTELSFAKRTGELTPEQVTALVPAAKEWLQKYVRDYVKQQNQPQVGVVFFGAVPRAVDANPGKSIEDAIQDLVKKNVSDEQRARYEAELAKRAEFRRQVVLDNLVAKIDARLYLGADQRTSLVAALTKNWDDSWAPAMDSMIHMGDYLPQIPDEHVTPLLNDQQKAVWNSVQKVSYGNFFGGDNSWLDGGQKLNDIDLGE
jgi:hypothetical protein